MMSIDTNLESGLPKGVKDFLPLKAAKIGHLTKTLQDVFAQWGFRPVVLPSLEFLDVLERGLGGNLREKTFRFDDRQSGRLVAFPPDITPQVARIAASRMRDLPLPLRLCYSGRVLRHTEHQAGKDREIFQAGVELIGLQNPEADAEMIAMAVEGLMAVGAKEFTIDIGQVEFFRGVMEGISVPDNLALQLRDVIGKKDSSGLQALLESIPLSDAGREEILSLTRLFGGREVLDRAEKVVTNDRSRRALDNLSKVLRILEVYGVEKHVTFDLGELRGLDYHTGITFQGFLGGMGRAVCSGGRYDNLTARYGYPAPATGFAFNLLNLLFALDRELDARTVHETDLLIFQPGDDKSPAQKAARSLRERGYSVARDMVARDLEATLEYARKTHYRYVLVIGREDGDALLIRPGDASERKLPYRELFSTEFAL